MTKESYVPVFNNTDYFYLGCLTYRYFMGSSHIVQKNIFKEYGGYDEKFGAGSKYYACEETDYLFRLLAGKEKVLYAPELVYYHPTGRNACKEKTYKYWYGNGALFAKHIVRIRKNIHIYLFLFFGSLIRTIFRILISFLKEGRIDKKQYYVLKGNLDGFKEYLFKNILCQ